MDNWSKKLLEQHGSVAYALKEIEQRNQFSLSVVDSVNFAVEYQHTALLSAVQDQASRLHAASKNLTVYSGMNRIDCFSTASEIYLAQEASRRHLATCSFAAINEARLLAESVQRYDFHTSHHQLLRCI